MKKQVTLYVDKALVSDSYTVAHLGAWISEQMENGAAVLVTTDADVLKTPSVAVVLETKEGDA